ncbi:Tigger transposable element-derived protein 6 [Dictyocoela muelleri]|nr:Tigger transposable element-derived protein 6 [Dictyocoela muelleri]
MDKSGIFYREIPTKTNTTRVIRGFKKNKNRVTVVFCVNSDGTDKKNLTIIGKYKKPRCLNNFNHTNFRDYVNNSTSWFLTEDFRNGFINLIFYLPVKIKNIINFKIMRIVMTRKWNLKILKCVFSHLTLLLFINLYILG